jgi:hypothetical protein
MGQGAEVKNRCCRRGSVNVRFAPKATDLLRCRDLTRCAITGREHMQQEMSRRQDLLDHLVGLPSYPRVRFTRTSAPAKTPSEAAPILGSSRSGGSRIAAVYPRE